MTNEEIIARRDLLSRLGDVRGKFGWYIYRNMKILSEACAEAIRIRDEAICKYGEDGSINPASDKWADFIAEIKPVMDIDQDVKMMKMPRDEFEKLAADGDLSAAELSILDANIVEE